MSYDLIIAPKTPNEDWPQVLTRLESHAGNPTSLSEGMRTRWQEVAERLAASGYERFEEADLVELDHPEHGIQITMFEHEAGLSVPYWYEGEEADEMLRLVGEVLDVVREVSGWSVYDPQLDREIFVVGDLVEGGEEVMSATARHLEEITSSGDQSERGAFMGPDDHKSQPKPNPWWRFWDRKT